MDAVLTEHGPALREELESLKAHSLHRAPESVSSRTHARIRLGKKALLDFSSNNYLGLASHPFVVREAARALHVWGAGSGASRLISGNLEPHLELERKIARFKKEAAALIFSSGYLANLGTIAALLNEKDLVIEDRLNHASLIDAARLSKAKFWVYPHKDAAALDRLLERAGGFRKKLVVTDAYFSMDGDVAPLDRILEVCRKRNAMLMIDEAHSTGVFGKKGRGLSEHFELEGKIDVVMGTLSKSLGSVGGFVAGSEELRDYLVNRCRTFIYTTAPSPAASAAALASLSLIEKDGSFRQKLWRNIAKVREGLEAAGFDLMGSEGPVIPVLVGETRKVLRFQNALMREGIFAPAIRPPTVPAKTDRIRLSVLASHSNPDLEHLLRVFKKLRRLL